MGGEMTEDKLKKEIAKSYNAWCEDSKRNSDKDFELSCVDRYGDNFPSLAISRSDASLEGDKEYDGWYPLRWQIKEEISGITLCSYCDDGPGKFRFRKVIPVNDDAIVAIMEIITPLLISSKENKKTYNDVQKALDRHAEINREDYS